MAEVKFPDHDCAERGCWSANGCTYPYRTVALSSGIEWDIDFNTPMYTRDYLATKPDQEEATPGLFESAYAKFLTYLVAGSACAVFVCAAIWLCATIIAAVPSTAR